ncbi:MAG: SHOCT domain-containing protein, partial [Gaiellaceae bacterium]
LDPMVTGQDPRIVALAAGAAPVPAPVGAGDLVELLQRLAELREQGVLTDDEFTAEKQNILPS